MIRPKTRPLENYVFHNMEHRAPARREKIKDLNGNHGSRNTQIFGSACGLTPLCGLVRLDSRGAEHSGCRVIGVEPELSLLTQNFSDCRVTSDDC